MTLAAFIIRMLHTFISESLTESLLNHLQIQFKEAS